MIGTLIAQEEIDISGKEGFRGIGPLGLEEGQAPFEVLKTALSNILTFLLTIGALWFFIQFLIGGIAWISSAGDKAKVEQARGRITSAIIGLFIILSAFAIAEVIERAFGIKITTLDIPGP